MYPQQDTADTDANENDGAAIILNPAGPDHDAPIPGVTTDQDVTVVDTDTSI